jgi:alkanesulfonate monooxygenase SsuD/methylene tetrahydromethanopterin reductase-like flavin-dependent oxidoreductase (luciferase family)
MATVDWLSQGRLFPAVGVGVELPREFEASGVPFAERGRRTDEAIHVLRLLWTQDEVTFQGQFYKLDRISVFPKPWQSPPPTGSAARASSHAPHRPTATADPLVTPEELRGGVHKVQDLAAAAGRQVPEDHFGTLVNFAIADTEEAALAMAQPYIPRVRVDEATMRQCTAFGPVDGLLDRVEEYVKAGASKFILRPLCPPDRMLDQLAHMADRLCPEYHRR